MSPTKTSPYFSIVIPCLNEEKYLPLLLKNLSQQTYQNFEVFIVDGNSQDSTPSIVTSYTSAFPLNLVTTNTRNVSHQRNLGASKSRGKILIFFDADTQIPKNYLEKIRDAFETKHPHFLNTYMKVDSQKAKDQWFPAFNNMVAEIGKIIKIPAAYGAAMAIKRTTFEDIGGFDQLTPFGEDSQLFQTALDYNYKYLILPSPRYTFSLRRLRSEGTLDAIYQYVRLNLSVIINGHHQSGINYPMGGHVHQSKKTGTDFTRRFDSILSRLSHTTAAQSKKISVFVNRFLIPKK